MIYILSSMYTTIIIKKKPSGKQNVVKYSFSRYILHRITLNFCFKKKKKK